MTGRKKPHAEEAQSAVSKQEAPRQAAPKRYVVARAADIPLGGVKTVTVRGREIALFNVAGEFFALLNRCPHEGAPLCGGIRVGLLESRDPGKYEYSREGEILRCPWHGWEFDLRTGQSYCDPVHTQVKAYPVAVEPGATVTKGPYVAETFPVTVEEEYVLIEL